MTTSTKTFDEMQEEKRSLRTILGGSLTESFFGGATIVLALMGLSGIMPELMLPVATITMGAAFLFESGSISMRFSRLFARTSADPIEKFDFGLGLTAEFVGGVTGVVLGVTALMQISPEVLVPVAVMVYGGTLILGSSVPVRLNELEFGGSEESARLGKIAREAMFAASGADIILGFSAMVLGIVALAEPVWGTLSLVALLVIGVSGFLDGAAITTRLAAFFRG